MHVDGSQFLAHHCQIVVFPKRFPCLIRFDFLQVRISILNRTKLSNDFRCCFLTYPRNPRNIIGRISHQCFYVNKLRWCYLISLFYVLFQIIFNCGLSALCLRDTDFDMFCGKLQQIPVTGQNGHVHSFFFSLSRERSQNIICLISFLCDHGDSHGSEHFLHNRNLLPQFLRHRFSGSLVSFIHFMTKRRCSQVKSHCQITGLLFLQNFKENRQKSIHRIRVQPVRIRQIRQSVKSTVHNTVSINQQ